MGAGTVFEQVVNLPQGSRGVFEYVIPANTVYSGSKYGPAETRILKVEYNTETPDVTLSRPLQNTERGAAVVVTAKWNHAVTGFALADLMADWETDPEMQEGTIDEFSDTEGTDTYTFRVNIPDNTKGEVVIRVPQNTATSVINSAKDGPPMARSIRIPFDRTTGPGPLVPDPATLTISKPLVSVYGLSRYTTRFGWSRRVTNFTASDVEVTILSGTGTFVKGTLEEDADTPGLWRMQLTLTGKARIQVSVAADSALAGTVGKP